MGAHALLDAVRSAWPHPAKGHFRFHHVSTDEVYGSLGPADPPFTESTPYAPSSPYSASKAAADHIVRAYAHTYGTRCTISNSSNNYGPYQFPEKLLPLCIVNILEGQPLPVYGDGMQIRDWLHVEDHCRAIELILNASPAGETWNVGGGSTEPNIRVIEAVCRLVDEEFRQRSELKTRYPRSAPAQGQPSRSLISYVKDRPGHDRRYAVDSGKIARLGFHPRTGLDTGLAATVRWYLEHESWWRAITSGEYRSWYARQYATT
jgi:dTDP-glucose 4,6-dehydratase